MDKRHIRLVGWVLVWLVGCALWWWKGEPVATAQSDQWTIPTVPPVLPNPGFECSIGYYTTQNPKGGTVLVPNGWTAIFLNGSPDISSTRRFYTGECNPNSQRFIEKLGGIDSFLVRSEDIESSAQPGKPFDVVIYYRSPATIGGEYSLSAWMTSKCGNANPVDCPGGNYITKAIAIDPRGGTNPNAPGVLWVTDNDNLQWQNLYTSSRALNTTITIYARMTSPFQFHGNLGFMDEFSLIRAPLSDMNPLPAKVEEIGELLLSWFGKQSEDVQAIVAGNYDLLFDVQTRALPKGAWRNIVTGAKTEQSYLFKAPCLDTRYEFRVRARAEQPDDEEGAFPNQRYPGVWSKPQTVLFTAPPAVPVTNTVVISPNLYLPLAANGSLGC
jgi:hypothetical protein